MICSNCGKEISDQEKYCRYCGSPRTGQKPAPKQKSRKKWIAAGIIAAAAAAALAVVLILQNSPRAGLKQF